MARIQADAKAFHPKTQAAIEYRLHEDDSRPRSLWKNAVNKIIQQQRSKAHYCNQLNASANQHMSAVDPFDGARARQGELTTFLKCSGQDEDLLVVSPAIDGRFKDEGRGQ